MYLKSKQTFKKKREETEEHLNELAVKQGIIWKDVIPDATKTKRYKNQQKQLSLIRIKRK